MEEVKYIMKIFIICSLSLLSICLCAQESKRITENDVIISSVGFSDELKPILEKEKTNIVDRLNYFYKKGEVYLTPINITLKYNDEEGTLVLELPFDERLKTSHPFIGSIRDFYGSHETINMGFVSGAFDILDLYKENLIYRFFSSGNKSASSKISNFSYTVVLQNERFGTATFTAKSKPIGRGYFITKDIVLDTEDGNSYIIKAQNGDINTLYDILILPEEKNEMSGNIDTSVILLKDFFKVPQIIKKDDGEQKEEDNTSINRFFVEKNEDSPLEIAEEMPEFPNMSQWISSNLRYPIIALEYGIQGTVVVAFVVNKDGTLSNLKIKESINPNLNKEALRVVKAMPKWTPGKQDGKNVSVKYSIPINFKLQESPSKKKRRK